MSNLIFICNILVMGMSGYYVATGEYFNAEFRIDLYLLYIFQIILLTFGLAIGNRIAIQPLAMPPTFIRNSGKLKIAICFVIVYGIVYIIYFFENIPLMQLIFTQNIDYAGVYRSRLEITHEFQNVFSDMPFLLRYWRNILHNFSMLLCCIIYAAYLQERDLIARWSVLPFVFITLFFSLLTFEKIIPLYLLFSLALVRIWNKKKVPFIRSFALIFCLIIAIYFFMTGIENLQDLLYGFAQRVFVKQTVFSYLQLEYWEKNYSEYLWGQSYPLTLLDNIMQRQIIDLSKDVARISEGSELYDAYGLTGTTGGLALVTLYTNFGFFLGSLFYFLVVLWVGFLDASFQNILVFNKFNPYLLGLYCFFASTNLLGLVGNINSIIQLPFIIPPDKLIILALFLLVLPGHSHAYLKNQKMRTIKM